MKIRFRLLVLVFLNFLMFSSCEVVPDDAVRPFSIQTNLNNGLNHIIRTFALPDNSLVTIMENRSKGTSTLYKYSNDLILVKTATIDGLGHTKPVFDDDGSFILISTVWFGDGIFLATRLSNSLEVLDVKTLKHLMPSSSRNIVYEPDITRLKNGNYVICYTSEEINPFDDEIVLFAVKDLFKDTAPIWSTVNNINEGEWAMEIESCPNGFIISGYDHTNRTEKFIIKYDESGKREWKNRFPYGNTNHFIFTEEHRLIYSDNTTFYAFDYDGNLLTTQEGIHGSWLPISNIVRKNDQYFYTGDYLNSDGNLLEIRKMDLALLPLQTALYGNRNTNVNAQEFRFLVKMTNGDMVAIASVQNPSLTGNYWLLLKFDEELKIQGQ